MRAELGLMRMSTALKFPPDTRLGIIIELYVPAIVQWLQSPG
jgi:hypothetical protein